MMKYPLAVGLVTLAIFSSCQKQIEIPIPVQQASYVVNCLFEPFTLPYPQNINVSVRRTIDIPDSLNFPAVDDAVIRFFYGDSLVANFEYLDTDEIYSTDKILALEPGLYRLEMEHDGKKYMASDILPHKVPLKKVVIDPYAGEDEYNHPFARVTFSFEDPPGRSDYYEISITGNSTTSLYPLSTDYSAITAETYYPTVLKIGQKDPKYLPFSDQLFDGEEVDVPVYYLHPVVEPGKHVYPHDITIHFRTISEHYYRYRISALKQNYFIEPDIIYGQAEPFNVYSNIPSNYGIFAGYQSVDHTFLIENEDRITESF